jgi:pimeloyl-ACP methyl ester carboxylesterase
MFIKPLTCSTLATFSFFVTFIAAAYAHIGNKYHATQQFNWSSIKPSTDLEYHDCDGEFKCARLLLPLNWLNESDHRRVSIAIKKLPATVPDDDPSFAGTLFTNPGGPGLSGVDFLSRMGHRLQMMADKPDARQYEILSFDPRGTGESRPRADCFPGDPLSRSAMLLEMRGTWGLDKGSSSLAYTSAIRDNFGRRCKDADIQSHIMAYAGTASVARDMVEILDKIDELRTRETSKDSKEWPELKKRNEAGVPRLQYIGFSYGTVLGNYFASLFPGRVGRMILDGVIDADDFANGPVSTFKLIFPQTY